MHNSLLGCGILTKPSPAMCASVGHTSTQMLQCVHASDRATHHLATLLARGNVSCKVKSAGIIFDSPDNEQWATGKLWHYSLLISNNGSNSFSCNSSANIARPRS